MTGTKATCSVDPGPIAVELSLNLLLASQLHEGPAIFNSLSLLGKFSAEANRRGVLLKATGIQYSSRRKSYCCLELNLFSLPVEIMTMDPELTFL